MCTPPIGNGISGSATQKIVELSRKNRDIHSELAKERTRVRQLQKQLSQLMAESTKQEQVSIFFFCSGFDGCA